HSAVVSAWPTNPLSTITGSGPCNSNRFASGNGRCRHVTQLGRCFSPVIGFPRTVVAVLPNIPTQTARRDPHYWDVILSVVQLSGQYADAGDAAPHGRRQWAAVPGSVASSMSENVEQRPQHEDAAHDDEQVAEELEQTHGRGDLRSRRVVQQQHGHDPGCAGEEGEHG